MRKYLGVLVAIAALCLMSWSQAPDQTPPSTPPTTSTPAPDSGQTPPPTPAPTPSPTQPVPVSTSVPPAKPGPQFPRLELFGGYSFAQAGFYNAGHWAQLNGWNGSFAINMVDHVGFVVDGSEYFGNSQIPTAVPAPFPQCVVGCPTGPTFNADTREYNVLFGLQFPFHRRERWTPFGELMFGHGGVRGLSYQNNVDESVVSSGLALLAGGGADYKINERFALRFKADYLQTHVFKQTQDNLRLSVGVVVRSVRKKRRTLEEDIPPE
ncbi:MAG: hypothetical protein WA618_06340 [Terriglobales bacterium]